MGRMTLGTRLIILIDKRKMGRIVVKRHAISVVVVAVAATVVAGICGGDFVHSRKHFVPFRA